MADLRKQAEDAVRQKGGKPSDVAAMMNKMRAQDIPVPSPRPGPVPAQRPVQESSSGGLSNYLDMIAGLAFGDAAQTSTNMQNAPSQSAVNAMSNAGSGDDESAETTPDSESAEGETGSHVAPSQNASGAQELSATQAAQADALESQGASFGEILGILGATGASAGAIAYYLGNKHGKSGQPMTDAEIIKRNRENAAAPQNSSSGIDKTIQETMDGRGPQTEASIDQIDQQMQDKVEGRDPSGANRPGPNRYATSNAVDNLAAEQVGSAPAKRAPNAVQDTIDKTLGERVPEVSAEMQGETTAKATRNAVGRNSRVPEVNSAMQAAAFKHASTLPPADAVRYLRSQGIDPSVDLMMMIKNGAGRAAMRGLK